MATKAKVKNQFKSTNNFVNKALAQLNKSEAQIQGEKLELFVRRSVIEVQQQISVRNSEISNLELDLQSANNKLDIAKDSFEAARFSPATNLEEYISKRAEAQQNINTCEDEIKEINNCINEIKEEIESLNEILVDFQ
jgi:predicted  nucleic acid-binding Zn-ribbon protein